MTSSPANDRAYTALIVGTGFGGQTAAMTLRKAGVEDFVMLERRDFMGGTWVQNSYPGAAVDVQSPLYSISSEPYAWERMFSTQEELEEYTNHVIDKHGLREKTRLNAEVTRLTWLEDDQLWEVYTEAAGTWRARFVVNASGPLSTPVVPPFSGRATYEGVQFHSNDWDHDFDHRGKRVAVIGSGASAAQIVPAIQPDVAELHVFQRTPHWVMPRPDHEFSPFERRLLGVDAVHRAVRTAIYWGLETRIIGFKYSDTMLRLVAQRKAKANIDDHVSDARLREKLTPDYRIGCKRIILSNALYPALDAENCTLYSGEHGEGIDRFDETGIHTTDGRHVEVDAIVYATGYDATDGLIAYPVIGRDGLKLGDYWDEFPRAYLGTTVPGFPNMYIVTGPNTGIGHTSAIFLIESQMEYIRQSVERVLAEGATAIEPTLQAEDDYTSHIHSEMRRTVWYHGGCNSWYKSADGHVVAMFPGFTFNFRRMTKDFKPEHHQLT
ncbi:NAD(P)/FAD-dependent oxidoreductase [Nocardioidaceae bacterium]|nr:NAD(P)/FAD-dependent oxidoreductase [Nocardioidaceae bacterium]